jgi:hypothetical protein
MKKYKASSWGELIAPIEVDGETKDFVVIKGRRSAKMSDSSGYFDTYDQAWEWHSNKIIQKINIARGLLEYEQKQLVAFMQKCPKNETN